MTILMLISPRTFILYCPLCMDSWNESATQFSLHIIIFGAHPKQISKVNCKIRTLCQAVILIVKIFKRVGRKTIDIQSSNTK